MFMSQIFRWRWRFDIVSALLHDDTIAWYENDGASIHHLQRTDIATNADGAYRCSLADMDGDGDVDIIVASSA